MIDESRLNQLENSVRQLLQLAEQARAFLAVNAPAEEAIRNQIEQQALGFYRQFAEAKAVFRAELDTMAQSFAAELAKCHVQITQLNAKLDDLTVKTAQNLERVRYAQTRASELRDAKNEAND
jgi:chromosome segregation ATPase